MTWTTRTRRRKRSTGSETRDTARGGSGGEVRVGEAQPGEDDTPTSPHPPPRVGANSCAASRRRGRSGDVGDRSGRRFSAQGRTSSCWPHHVPAILEVATTALVQPRAARACGLGAVVTRSWIFGRKGSVVAMAAPQERPGESSSEGQGSVPETSTRRLREQSQLDFELEFLGRILERDPLFTDALRVHGNNLSAKGQYARALQVDRRLVRLLPDRADPLVQPGLQLCRPGDGRSGILGAAACSRAGLPPHRPPPSRSRPQVAPPRPPLRPAAERL